jgi:hypothetical protein
VLYVRMWTSVKSVKTCASGCAGFNKSRVQAHHGARLHQSLQLALRALRMPSDWFGFRSFKEILRR